MARWTVMLVVAALACGCKERKKENEPSPSASASADSEKTKTKTTRKPPPSRVSVADTEKLLAQWLASQNDGSFDTYAALYADGFQGVRRSGKKTVRLDRAGWLGDRKRMFKKKMTVKASSKKISAGIGGAKIRFTQTWSSGTYQDVGPKILEVIATPLGLRISKEELIASTLTTAPKDLPVASDAFALVYKGQIVLAVEPEVDGFGNPGLESGGVSEPEPNCDRDFDYETENNDYFRCYDADPDNRSGTHVATQEVRGQSDKMWTGKKFALYDRTGRRCVSEVGALNLRAELYAAESVLGTFEDPEEIHAQVVLDSGGALLVGDLNNGCDGAAFARNPAWPAPKQWPISKAGPKMEERARAFLAKDPEFLATKEWPVSASVEIEQIGQPAKLIAISITGAETCQEDTFLFFLLRATDSELLIQTGGLEFDLVAAADLTGNGAPELVLSTGILVASDSAALDYKRLEIVDFNLEVGDACHCECE